MKSDNSNIARKSLFLLSYNIFGAATGYITMFFALRFVGQDVWGIYGSALGIAGLLGVVSFLGVDGAHVKKITQKKDKEECMGAYLLIKGFLGFIFLLISFGGFFLLGNVFGYKFESPYLEKAVYIAIFGMLLSSIANIFNTSYRAKLDAKKSVLPLFIQVTVQDTFIILFSLYFKIISGTNREFLGVLFSYAYLLGNFSKLIIYIVWSIKDTLPIKKPKKSLVKEYILFSIPLALQGIVATIQAYTDRTMLQFFWNSTEVGGYFTVQKLALFITYLGSSVTFFLYPAQSTYYERRDIEFFNITQKSERYLSLISVPFVFFTISMAPEILNIFRSSIIPYSTPLIILMIYAYLNVINKPYGTQLTSANRPYDVMRMGIIQASANVVLNAIFIPKSILGIPLLGLKSTGAALATLLSFLIGFAYLRYRAWKILGTKYEKSILYHLLAGFFVLMFIFLLKYLIGAMYAWYEIAGMFLIFIGTYVFLLYLIGELSKEDWKIVLRIIKKA